MSTKLELETMKAIVDSWTTEQAREFLRRVTGSPIRELTGTEYDHTWTLLQLLEPISESNNQRAFTKVYQVSNTMYWVTYWPSKKVCDHWIEVPPTIEVILVKDEDTDD